MDKYIKLTVYTTNNVIMINSIMICTIIDRQNFTQITTMDSKSYDVVESINVVTKFIDDASKIKLVNT